MKLRFTAFNVENLFIYLDHYKNQDPRKLTEAEWQTLSSSVIPNKPLQKILGLAASITDIDPDILMLSEVGGLESLENFNRHFLNQAYVPLLIEGNSDRGIDLAYLVKRNLPFKYDLRTYRQRPIHFLYPHESQSNASGYKKADGSEYKSHRFSRDVLELRVFDQEAELPKFICLLVHLKSKWDRDGFDPSGRDRRAAELKTLIEIYGELNQEFASRVPVLVGGDFNGRATIKGTDKEFAEIYQKSDLKDCLELAQVPEAERATHIQVSNSTRSEHNQLDYLFLPHILHDKLITGETFVYRFKDDLQSPYPLPTSMQMKRELPSDHYPVVTTLLF